MRMDHQNSDRHVNSRISAATCSSKSGQVYASSYDAWGNVTSRTYSSTTATLDLRPVGPLRELECRHQPTQDLYVYDASGTRVLRRTTNGSGTTMRVYAFGLEAAHLRRQWQPHQRPVLLLVGRQAAGQSGHQHQHHRLLPDRYAGQRAGQFQQHRQSAAIAGNQVFGPYGNMRDVQGNFNTPKAFTGQDNDSLTELDYYGSRYYDQVAGVFLSADVVQGNMQGMNPYALCGWQS